MMAILSQVVSVGRPLRREFFLLGVIMGFVEFLGVFLGIRTVMGISQMDVNVGLLLGRMLLHAELTNNAFLCVHNKVLLLVLQTQTIRQTFAQLIFSLIQTIAEAVGIINVISFRRMPLSKQSTTSSVHSVQAVLVQ